MEGNDCRSRREVSWTVDQRPLNRLPQSSLSYIIGGMYTLNYSGSDIVMILIIQITLIYEIY